MTDLALFVCSLATALEPLPLPGDVLRVGPGQEFASVQAAVDAARSGDLVLVEPGIYSGFAVVGKGIAIVAAEGTFAVRTAPGVPAILVQDVPARRTLTVCGAVVHYAEPSAPAVRVSSNGGAVRFSRLAVSLDGDLGSATVRAALEVERTETFWLSDSRVWSDVPRSGSSRLPTGENDGISAIELLDSDAVLQNVRVRGYDNPGNYAGDGLRVRDDSAVWLRDQILRGHDSSGFAGGNGGAFGGHALHLVFTERPAHIEMCPSVGFSAGTGTIREGGFLATNDDNGIRTGPLLTIYTAPDLCVTPQIVENSLPTDTVRLGDALQVRLWSVASGSYGTVLTARTRYERVLAGFYGHPLIDPSARVLVTLSTGKLPGGVLVNLSVPVPAIPELAGFQLTVQTAFLSDAGFDAISAPDMVVVVP